MFAKSLRTSALVCLNVTSCPFLYIIAAVAALSMMHMSGASMTLVVLAQVAALAVIASSTVAWMALRDVDGPDSVTGVVRVGLIFLTFFAFFATVVASSGNTMALSKVHVMTWVVGMWTAAEGMLVAALLMQFGQGLVRCQPATR